jgi:hypothetical protein
MYLGVNISMSQRRLAWRIVGGIGVAAGEMAGESCGIEAAHRRRRGVSAILLWRLAILIHQRRNNLIGESVERKSEERSGIANESAQLASCVSKAGEIES